MGFRCQTKEKGEALYRQGSEDSWEQPWHSPCLLAQGFASVWQTGVELGWTGSPSIIYIDALMRNT